MNLKEQLYICTLAQCQSISKASEKLYISQPALSMYLNNLENTLGVKLFYRKDKKLLPTYAGQCYLEKAERMLEMKHEFDTQLFGIRNGLRGQLRLGVQQRRAPYFLTPVLERFKQEYPEVQLIIKDNVYKPLLQLFQNDDIDLLISTIDGDLLNCEQHLIYKERLLVMLPQHHPACATAREVSGQPFPILDLKQLDGERFLLQTEQQSLRRDCDRALASCGVIPGNIEVISSIEFCMQLVAEGMGVGFNREGYIKYIRYDKPVRYFDFEPQPRLSAFVVANKKGALLPDYAQRMIALLVEQGKDAVAAVNPPGAHI
ncbi:MAG: Transcriptional regulator [Oscillospiraceae bacterium]|jgi:DNA-binding transcriptional LysR family regulator|nr:Transcriptional regulator [Oscillospiraceae bacterium]